MVTNWSHGRLEEMTTNVLGVWSNINVMVTHWNDLLCGDYHTLHRKMTIFESDLAAFSMFTRLRFMFILRITNFVCVCCYALSLLCSFSLARPATFEMARA